MKGWLFHADKSIEGNVMGRGGEEGRGCEEGSIRARSRGWENAVKDAKVDSGFSTSGMSLQRKPGVKEAIVVGVRRVRSVYEPIALHSPDGGEP